jgi:hypothetical protein
LDGLEKERKCLLSWIGGDFQFLILGIQFIVDFLHWEIGGQNSALHISSESNVWAFQATSRGIIPAISGCLRSTFDGQFARNSLDAAMNDLEI